MSNPKELNFFIAERNYARGLEWYSRHFDPTARCRGESSPNYTAYPQHLGVPERMAAVGAGRAARLHRPRPDRADHRALDPQLRQAPREGRPARDAAAPEHLLRHPQQVLHAARALPRALPARSRSSCSTRTTCATSGCRRCAGVFEFAGVDPAFEHPKFEQVRHSTSRKKRATRLGMRVQKREPHRLRPPGAAPRLAGDGRRPAAVQADRPSPDRRSPRRSAPRCSRSCTRTPTGCARRPAATSRTGRFERRRRAGAGQRPQAPLGRGREDRRRARHAGAALLGHPRRRHGRLERAHVRVDDRHRQLLRFRRSSASSGCCSSSRGC